MDSSRPVPWVSPLLYLAVLFAGVYAGMSGLGDTHYILFLGGIAALLALELPAAQRFSDIVRLGMQSALFLLIAVADGSGLSRVLFVLVPFTAYFAFGRIAAITLGGACLGLLLVAGHLDNPRWYTDLERVSDLLMFGLGLVLAIAMASVAAEERLGRTRIAELSAAAERTRIARDIHDDLGHHLTAVIVSLDKAAAYRERDPATAEQALTDATKSARTALDDVRRAVSTVSTPPTGPASARPGLAAKHSIPDRAGTPEAASGRADPTHAVAPFRLGAALGDLVGGAIPVEITGDEARYGEAALRVLYRAAQEGITNARRHSRASTITVTVTLDPERARLTVTDDGDGFLPGREGFGLRSMRERVSLVGGSVVVGSAAGIGTTLMVVVPGEKAS